jgi:hypothetical protein
MDNLTGRRPEGGYSERKEAGRGIIRHEGGWKRDNQTGIRMEEG